MEMITMTMLVPRRSRKMMSSFMNDPFETFFNAPVLSNAAAPLMRTDIRESENGYELVVDLPGFDKEEVRATLEEGVLTISAETKSESEEKDPKGAFVRRERFSGKCSRSYFVDDEIEEGDIRAKFVNGTLQIDIPKKQPEPKPETKQTIAIEG
mgnify:FL=1